MGEKKQSSNQTNQTQELKQAARDEALSAAEKGLEAAREALEQAEQKLAEAQQTCKTAEQQQNTERVGGASDNGVSNEATQAAAVAAESCPSAAGAYSPQEQYYQPQGQPHVASNFATGAYSAEAVNPAGAANSAAYNASNANSAGAASANPAGNTQNQGYWQGQAAQGGYQSQPAQPAVNPSSKDHVAAGLLAIFLGTFGIHKFYLGYNTQGFIMLAISILAGVFTFGIAAGVIWVIAVIEGVLYLTKNQSDFERIYVYNKREWF